VIEDADSAIFARRRKHEFLEQMNVSGDVTSTEFSRRLSFIDLPAYGP